MRAKAESEYLTVLFHHAEYLTGEKVLEVSCADYDEFRKLPSVVSYEHRLYGKSGWSSDTNRACYKTDASFAKVVK